MIIEIASGGVTNIATEKTANNDKSSFLNQTLCTHDLIRIKSSVITGISKVKPNTRNSFKQNPLDSY